MTRTRSLLPVSLLAGALLGGFGPPAPAAAEIPIAAVAGPGSGRAGASLAAVVGLIAVAIGGRALARSAGRVGQGGHGAVAALAAGLVGTVLAGLHLATNVGAIGTGHGRAGAIVAAVLGPIGMILGGLARFRCRRTA